MRLAKGMRVGIGVEEGVTCIAVIHSVNDDAIDLDLLDQIEFQEICDEEMIIFAPDARGLHYWRATAPLPPEGGRLSLTLIGPSEMTQRRRYQRFAVDLEAQIQPVRRGRRARSTDVHVVDLSYGGAKIIGMTPTETGDTVIINLDLGAGPLVATARVAMSYSDNGGRRVSHLAFTPPEESRVALLGIERYLSTLS